VKKTAKATIIITIIALSSIMTGALYFLQPQNVLHPQGTQMNLPLQEWENYEDYLIGYFHSSSVGRSQLWVESADGTIENFPAENGTYSAFSLTITIVQVYSDHLIVLVR